MKAIKKGKISNFFVFLLIIGAFLFFCFSIYKLNYYYISFEEKSNLRKNMNFYYKFYSLNDPVYNIKGSSVCRSFNNQDEIYYLEGDIEVDSNCFYINNKNITFDCQGNKIRYNGGGFLFLSFFPETKIINCVIEGDINSYSSGIFYFENSNNSYIVNNSIDINSNGITIFKFKSSNNAILSENYIVLSGYNSYVFNFFDGSSNFLINQNLIEVYGSEQTIAYFENSNDVEFFNNTLLSKSDESVIFLIDYSKDFLFFKNYIEETGVNSVVLQSSYSKYLNFKNNNISISSFNSNPFSYYYGENLSIIGNEIKYLEKGTFFDFFNSRNFNLSYNYIILNSSNKTLLKIYEEAINLSSNIISYNIFNISNGVNDIFIEANNSNLIFFENELYFTNETAYFLFDESNIFEFIKNNCTNLSFIFASKGNQLTAENSCSQYLFVSGNETNSIFIREIEEKTFLIEEDFKGKIFFYKNISITLLKDNKPLSNLFFCLYFFNKSLVFCNQTNDYGNSFFWLNNKIIANNFIGYFDSFYLLFKENGKDVSFLINISQYDSFLFNIPSFLGKSSGNSNNQKISGFVGFCREDLYCEDWSVCLEGKSKRICKDRNNCISSFFEERNCSIKSIFLKEPKNLFDIILKIFNKRLKKGEELAFSVSLLNIGSSGRVFGNLTYSIYDSKNNLVYIENEIIPVETQIDVIKEISLKNLSYGRYLLVLNLSYEGQKDPAFSSETFEIIHRDYYSFVIFILIFIAISYPIIKLFLKQ